MPDDAGECRRSSFAVQFLRQIPVFLFRLLQAADIADEYAEGDSPVLPRTAAAWQSTGIVVPSLQTTSASDGSAPSRKRAKCFETAVATLP